MKTLIVFTLGLILCPWALADDPSMFDMVEFHTLIKKTEQKIYYGHDNSGKEWRGISQAELDNILKIENEYIATNAMRREECPNGMCPVPKKQSINKKEQPVRIEPVISAPLTKVYGKDRYGRLWMADDQEKLKAALDWVDQQARHQYYTVPQPQYRTTSPATFSSGGG
jgi:hypothetical protein